MKTRMIVTLSSDDNKCIGSFKTTVVTGGSETTYPYEAHVLSPGFSGVHVTRSEVLYICIIDRCLSFSIVLSVLLRYTDSDYPFGIFKLFLI